MKLKNTMNIKNITIFVLIITIILISCNQSTVKNDVKTVSVETEPDRYSEFNNRLKKAENIISPIELIKYYFGEIDAEEDIDIKVDRLDVNQYKIQLVQQNIRDDSISGMMVVMFAKQENDIWTVQDIKRTWKCQKGRGHSVFSSEPCL